MNVTAPRAKDSTLGSPDDAEASAAEGAGVAAVLDCGFGGAAGEREHATSNSGARARIETGVYLQRPLVGLTHADIGI